MPHVPPEAGSGSEPVPSVPRTAADIMTEPVVSVAPAASVREIAKLLVGKRISADPAVDRSGGPIGMVSEADLLGRGGRPSLPGTTGGWRCCHTKARGSGMDEGTPST
jgi:hypothetical protein